MTLTPGTLLSAPTTAVDAGYRAVASLVSLGALGASLGPWPSPLAALAAVPLPPEAASALAWVPVAAEWTAEHPALTGVVGFVLLLLGLTAAAHEPTAVLPAASRAGATAALGLAAVAQVDQLAQAGFTLAVFVAGTFVVRGITGRGADTSELLGSSVVHLIGAALAVPLALLPLLIGSKPAEEAKADDKG